MSLKKPTNLVRLLLIANRYYSDAGTIASFGWDFAKDKLQPPDSGDGLARFVCSEMEAVLDETQSPMEQILCGAAYMEKASKELSGLAGRMESFVIMQSALEFFSWLETSKRRCLSEGLIQSWLDVHPLPEIRNLGEFVKEEILSLVEGAGERIGSDGLNFPTEVLAAVIDKAKARVSLESDLAEILKPNTPDPAEVAPSAPSPPTT